MKTKNAIVFILILLLWSFAAPIQLLAEERHAPRLTMEDLTDPSSPSYVPFPFPKSREEIIKNLKYQLSKMYSGKRWEISTTSYINLLPEIVNENPGAAVGEIVKVKNRLSFMPYPFSYLIFISDLKGKYTARVAMSANGLILGGADPSNRDPGIKLKKLSKVLEKMERFFKKSDVKSIERVAYGIGFATKVHPIYEITLNNGTKFFYDHRGKAYKKVGQKTLKGNLNTERATFVLREKKKLNKDEKHLFDWISQEFIILKKLK